MPELSQAAAYTNKTFSRTEIQGLVQYAKVRGIKVVPEIDSPGHAPKRFESLGSNIVQCTDVKYNNHYYCGEPPAGQWNLTNTDTMDVIKTIWN